MLLYDVYLIIDWSAANAPKRGKDSIWIGEARRTGGRINLLKPVNPSTRAEAIDLLIGRIERHLENNKRVFTGFDFPFGYPAGAAKLITGKPRWDALWKKLHEAVEDAADNQSNRYALAAHWNKTKFPAQFFWGHPHQHRYDHLMPKKPAHDAFKAIECRVAEQWQKPAKSVWQLAYNGAVGSQAMLGMARLQALREQFGERATVWPFETGWNEKLNAPLVITEVYPSMFEPEFRKGDVKDAAQVRTVAKLFAKRDASGTFHPLLGRPPAMSDAEAKKVMREEGWIVGAGHSIEPA